MVNFETLILSAPQGFTRGCKDLGKQTEDQIMEVSELAVKISKEGLLSSSSQATEAVKALVYVIFARNTSVPSPEVCELASVLDTHTLLTRAAITSLVAALEAYPVPKNTSGAFAVPTAEGDGEGVDGSSSTRRGGALTGLQWKLGVSLASSSCKSLMSPYVALSFNVRDTNGDLKVHTTELTYKEFVDLHATVKEVAARMETI